MSTVPSCANVADLGIVVAEPSRQAQQTGDLNGQRSKAKQSGTQEAKSGKVSYGDGRTDRISWQADAGAAICRFQETLRRSMGIKNSESLGLRSTELLAIFEHPFKLSALDGEQPPGTYRVVIDEEELLGLSFLAYRRVATMLHIPSLETSELSRQVFTVDADELAAAIKADH